MKSILLVIAVCLFSNSIKSQLFSAKYGYLEINVKYTGKSQTDLPPPPPGLENNLQQIDISASNFENEGFKIKIWFDTTFEKVVNTVYGRNTFLYNSLNKTTIILHEISGVKLGYIANQQELEYLKKYWDSLINKKNLDTFLTRAEYTNETQLINGFNCKKAFLITQNKNTITDTAIVWYSPDYKLPDNFYFSTDHLEHNSKLACLKIINGFPIKVDIAYTKKMRIELEVKKADFKKAISVKEFSVSSAFSLKPIREKYGLN